MTAPVLPFPTNECVNLLADQNPAAIDVLRQRFPAHAHLLERGMQMGDDASMNKAVFVAELIASALEEAHAAVSLKLESGRQRIRRADGWQSLSQYAALILSGTTIGLISLDQKVAAQLTTLGSVLGSICGLASERILVVVDPAAGSFRSTYLALVGLAERITVLKREALIHAKFPGSDQAVNDLAGQANAVCLEVRQMGAQLH